MGHTTDKRLEHAEHTQHHAHDPFDRRVALTMAIIAAILAGVTLLSHRGHTETLRLSTQSNIHHTQATDQWNLYQAKNIRSYEFQAFLMTDMLRSAKDPSEAKPSLVTGSIRKYWIRQIDKYEGKGYWAKMVAFLEGHESQPPKRRSKDSELQQLMDEARKQEEKAKEKEHESHQVHAAVNWLDLGHLAIELALVLCAVSVLTKQRSFWMTGILVGLIGAGLAGYGGIQWVLGHPDAAHHAPAGTPSSPSEGHH
jgi:hypothetical protein